MAFWQFLWMEFWCTTIPLVHAVNAPRRWSLGSSGCTGHMLAGGRTREGETAFCVWSTGTIGSGVSTACGGARSRPNVQRRATAGAGLHVISHSCPSRRNCTSALLQAMAHWLPMPRLVHHCKIWWPSDFAAGQSAGMSQFPTTGADSWFPGAATDGLSPGVCLSSFLWDGWCIWQCRIAVMHTGVLFPTTPASVPDSCSSAARLLRSGCTNAMPEHVHTSPIQRSWQRSCPPLRGHATTRSVRIRADGVTWPHSTATVRLPDFRGPSSRDYATWEAWMLSFPVSVRGRTSSVVSAVQGMLLLRWGPKVTPIFSPARCAG